MSLFSRAGNPISGLRIIASTNTLKKCSQIKNISNMQNIDTLDIRCSVTEKKKSHGVKYKTKSKIRITKSSGSNEAVVSVETKIRDSEDHVTEAAANHCTDCFDPVTVNLADLKDASAIASTLANIASDIVDEATDDIETEVEEAYELKKQKEELAEQIAECEISKKSTVSLKRKIKAEEKIECRRDQLAEIENSRARTAFFHSTVKPDLWYLAQQDKPLDRSLFLTDSMKDLTNPDFFSHDYFSVKSAIETIYKYNDLRSIIDTLGENKKTALDNIAAQLPFYFYTDSNTLVGRQDRRLLERAWNANFEERPFPQYYSLSNRATPVSSARTNTMSAKQFRSIVNSKEFRSLYQ